MPKWSAHTDRSQTIAHGTIGTSRGIDSVVWPSALMQRPAQYPPDRPAILP